MAKYDWKQLEKDYITGEYKSVSQFIRSKEIPYNGTTKSKTKGWTEKKRLKQDQKATKTIEKLIEIESEKEAQQIVDIKSIANDIALNIIKANKETNLYIDTEGNIKQGLIDKRGLKQLTSALKDLNEILTENNESNNTDLTNAKEILVKIKEVAENDTTN